MTTKDTRARAVRKTATLISCFSLTLVAAACGDSSDTQTTTPVEPAARQLRAEPSVRAAVPRRITAQEAQERLKGPKKEPPRALGVILADVKATLPDDPQGTRHALMQEYLRGISAFAPDARRQAVQRLADVFETR